MQLPKRATMVAAIITGITTIGVLGGAGTAAAGPCEARTMSMAFAPWGDHNQYFVANGGTFERGTNSWGLRNRARIAAGQNPHAINGWGNASLRLPPRASAVSPDICVHANEESLRFFYQAPGRGAALEVHVEVANDQGIASTTTIITASTRRWEVSPIIELPNLRDPDGQQWITIRFTSLQNRGAWKIDDVMIDPWVAR